MKKIEIRTVSEPIRVTNKGKKKLYLEIEGVKHCLRPKDDVYWYKKKIEVKVKE